VNKVKILGCWYSNCGINKKIMNASLKSIHNAVSASNVSTPNVVTCNWSKLQNNPFKEHITLYPLPVHMGIVLQMLKILYEEKKCGNTYDIISFLEHDVLYPLDYFDRVSKAFTDNEGVKRISNMDYIGINETGFLAVVCRQEPMHQLSFEYNFGFQHIENLMKSAIINGNVMLENCDCKKVQIPYNGEKPSCHINHSKHFTSHFNCYEKKSSIGQIHPYWGDCSKFYPKNEKSMT